MFGIGFIDHYIHEHRKLKVDNQHYVVSQICANPYTVFTLTFKIHLFNFPLLTCCSRIMLCWA